jgi:hypothetical protein
LIPLARSLTVEELDFGGSELIPVTIIPLSSVDSWLGGVAW